MKTLIRFAIITLTVLTSASLFAQEWTKEQSEVWKVIENNWKNLKAGNVDPSVLVFHEKYQGWSSSLQLPINKDQAIAMFQPLKDAWKMQDYFINPARIAVVSNAAVVHYYFQFNLSMGAGEDSKMVHHQGKYTEFYVKENGKWMCLGDMTVYEEE
ncbi:MAG: hypothetical protein PHD61_06350 [Bacteroidales bacterium]|nr:hypothetical protein [Lentimicrobiaceae bacterium]MDD5694909.1 hypothetical protein [Bacteroidales bacterium]